MCVFVNQREQGAEQFLSPATPPGSSQPPEKHHHMRLWLQASNHDGLQSRQWVTTVTGSRATDLGRTPARTGSHHGLVVVSCYSSSYDGSWVLNPCSSRLFPCTKMVTNRAFSAMVHTNNYEIMEGLMIMVCLW
ncbi:hypothetical protein R6Q59_012597 [Mikania micrantha]